MKNLFTDINLSNQNVMKEIIVFLENQNYKLFIKALISLETNTTNSKELDNKYNLYLQNDSIKLLNDIFN